MLCLKSKFCREYSYKSSVHIENPYHSNIQGSKDQFIRGPFTASTD